MSQSVTAFLGEVAKRNANEPEFMQAVREVAETVIPFIEANPKYQGKMLLERMVEPERVIMFRIAWIDDKGATQVNRGFRIQMNSAIGPYKGGIRFHPSVNLSILKLILFQRWKMVLFLLGINTLHGHFLKQLKLLKAMPLVLMLN